MTNLTDIRSSAISAAGAGLTVYATKEDLPASGLTSGDQAYVTANSRLYVSNGSGWYNVALINATPSLTISPSGAIELSTLGATTTITLTATDSDNAVAGLTYSVESDGSFGGLATVSQDSSVFTITPLSEDSATTTESTLTFKASDGISFGSGSRTLTLQFKVPNSNYTTLLMQADIVDSDIQVDLSSTNTTMIQVGSVPATAFTPYHPGGYSTYFDGTGDYLSVAYSADHTFGSGTFTVECWVYMTAYEGGGFNTFLMKTDGTNTDWQLDYKNTSTELRFIPYVSGSANTSAGVATATLSLNTWHHVAVSRDGSNNLRLFLDGSLLKTSTYSSTIDADGDATLEVGARNNGGTRDRLITGYIRDVRIVKGTAVYTTTFSSPSEPLTAITNTTLLACHLPYFADGSTSDHTLTIAGNTSTKRFGPYDYKKYTKTDHGGSVYFNNDVANSYRVDGTAAYGTGDFTLEFWIWFESVAAGATLFDGRPTNGNGAYITIANSISSGVGLYVDSTYRIQGGILSANRWYHIAVSRVSGTTTMYLNGKSIGSFSDSFNYIAGASRPVVGRNGYSAASPVNGYISDLRSVKGTGVYTANFIPPTEPLTDVTNTELLTFRNKNDIWDASANVPLLTKSGSVTTSTSEVDYSGTSIYYSTRSDQILGDGTKAAFNTLPGDFTIELECKLTSSTMTYAFVFQLYSGSNSDNAIIRFGDSGFGYHLQFIINNGGGTGAVYNVNLVQSDFTSAFRHIAWTRESGTNRVFIDGTQYNVATGTNPSTFTNASWSDSTTISFNNSSGIYIGRASYAPLGYLQNVRVTNGLARYTGNFTPPTTEFDG